MKKTVWFIPVAAMICGGLWLRGNAPAHAYPSTSPSAKQAVRLKYHPPRNWMRHYLGDDRYKVAGGVWKVVSTQLDTFYHRPNCPNMMRQSANLVIGFPSPEAAIEGGYKPDPVCQPDVGDVAYSGGSSAGSGSSGGRGVTTVNLGKKSQRITLADGKSTALLPPSWRRTQSGASTIAGQSTLSDTLQPLQGKGFVRFSFVPVPANLPIDASKIFRPSAFASSFGNLPGGQAGKIIDNLLVGNGQLGKMEGVTLTAKSGTIVPGVSGNAVVAANKNKIYVVEDTTKGSSTAKSIIKSFQPK